MFEFDDLDVNNFKGAGAYRIAADSVDFGQSLMVVMTQHHLFMEEERAYEERHQKRMLARQASFQENLFKVMNMQK